MKKQLFFAITMAVLLGATGCGTLLMILGATSFLVHYKVIKTIIKRRFF